MKQNIKSMVYKVYNFYDAFVVIPFNLIVNSLLRQNLFNGTMSLYHMSYGPMGDGKKCDFPILCAV